MRDRPDGKRLLELARSVFLAELLPRLPEDKRYDGLMVAAAMAIGARELGAGAAPYEEERRGLMRILDEMPTGDEPLEAALERLNRRLAQELRAGRWDGDPAVHALLHAAAVARLKENNPKLLRAEGLDAVL
jgi:hypothetical protein